MQIVYHVGAHGTDHERIARTLMRNREELWEHGVEIPAPGRYKGVFGETMKALNGGAAPADVQEMLLDALLDNDSSNRIILSQSSFLGMPQRAISPTGLYPRAPGRMSGLSNLFPDNVVEFVVTVMHPAKLVLEIVKMSNGNYETVMGGVDPAALSWSPAIRNILQLVPDRDIVVFAQEDLPFIMPEVLHRMVDIDDKAELKGELDLLAEILGPEAFKQFQQRLAEAEDDSISTRRNLTEEALLAAAPSAFEEIVALPGWSQPLIDELSESYAHDLAEIAALPGVEFISA
ncbi:hypothetical protein [Paracoccus aerodenitrificans]|uniref:hypothetical protein n=1 Tax=Paracoccus aerodenitrificans TaxID=3017781 RepID=UPI0022EFF06F|nr:hypothetical protein [Paracoccus aerodenitrificans]WBU63228.1 hypothetical protein PAE61_12780 [Paracoccus aerodenitrificans]